MAKKRRVTARSSLQFDSSSDGRRIQTDPRLVEYRRAVIRAIAADDELSKVLVLKGGNALRLVHDLGARTSQDVDYSLESDFADAGAAREQLRIALEQEFLRLKLHVVDYKFAHKPKHVGVARAGGYIVTFKLATRDLRERHAKRPDRLSAEAEVVSPGQGRMMEIEISKNEFCGTMNECDVDGLLVRVCAPELIAVEKLRALCQQMPEYSKRRNKAPRARDFYDIHAIVSAGEVDFRDPDIHELVRASFEVKEVPLTLLARISNGREFHRAGWPEVEGSVSGALLSYDVYFDFVVEHAAGLEPLWTIDPP